MTINWGMVIIAAMVAYSRWPLDLWYEWAFTLFVLASSVVLPLLEQRVFESVKRDITERRERDGA